LRDHLIGTQVLDPVQIGEIVPIQIGVVVDAVREEQEKSNANRRNVSHRDLTTITPPRLGNVVFLQHCVLSSLDYVKKINNEQPRIIETTGITKSSCCHRNFMAMASTVNTRGVIDPRLWPARACDTEEVI
jgi:hypothetical protein